MSSSWNGIERRLAPRLGERRMMEWVCSCLEGSDIRAWSCTKCPRCKMDRPERDGSTAEVESSRDVMDALEAFDRMAPQYGRPQALRQVLMIWGRR